MATNPTLVTDPSDVFFTLFYIGFVIALAFIHINVAVNLYKFGRKYSKSAGHNLLFVHPVLLAIVGLIFGLFAAGFVNVISSLDRAGER